MIKAIFFDFDGVLTLDASGSQSVCNYICAQTGISKTLFADAYKKYNPDLQTGQRTHEDIWDSLCMDIGQPIDSDIRYDSFINTPMNLEMLELARQLKANDFSIGIITDNKTDRMKSIANHHGLYDIFDSIIVSAEIGSGKKQDHIFLKAFESLAVSPQECIFIDNKESNLVVPRNLGVAAIYFDHSKNDISGLKQTLCELDVLPA